MPPRSSKLPLPPQPRVQTLPQSLLIHYEPGAFVFNKLRAEEESPLNRSELQPPFVKCHCQGQFCQGLLPLGLGGFNADLLSGNAAFLSAFQLNYEA